MMQHMRGFRLQPYQCRILYAFLTRMAVLIMFLLEAHVTMATVPHLILEFDCLPEVNVTMATLSTVALAMGGILTVVLALGGILTIDLALEEVLLLLLRIFDARWHKSQFNMAIPLVKMIRTTLTYLDLDQVCRKALYLRVSYRVSYRVSKLVSLALVEKALPRLNHHHLAMGSSFQT